MAASNSSCSPSSSAVTIPIPGKSILKRPPPTPPSLLSRITRFLPTPNQPPTSTGAEDASKPLKRAHFILPEIAIVYPISSVNPPSTPTLKEEKKAIEVREAERRKRVVRGNANATSSAASSPALGDSDDWWSMDKVESFYRECCAGCDEKPDLAITKAFKNVSQVNPRSVDFSGVQLTMTSASILSDVFTIEWGLRKLVFRECDLDDQVLKPMLHALLIPDTLSFLSVASNRRLKAPAFRIIGAYLAQSKTLQFLDLSQNALDKKSTEYIVAALATAPDPGLVSLRLDDCSLRAPALEVLARTVRTSSLRNISLRHNRINATGAIALALMIRDYPDVVPAGLVSPTPSTTSSSSSSPTSSFTNLPAALSPPVTPASASSTGSLNPLPAKVAQSPVTRSGPIFPPPRHPPTGVQTTYTPYVPRSRRQPNHNLNNSNSNSNSSPSPNTSTVPLITSSSQGGVTTRHSGLDHNNSNSNSNHNHVGTGPSAALLDKVRALDALPRLGALRTLDLKGNDLRMGITYLAQVLKRNRTLKVLNLSENKLDVSCLVAIAEALKYNSCLETLDLSKNPCSGPALEGIQSLRTAFTLNTALKRLFLSSTSLTSAGAIALAEFLPESTSLLHLDLTMNNLDIAGVMALSSGLKANHVMRCLDLNIPPGDEGFARMCRDILNSCVRNTEEAERNSHANSANGSASIASAGTGAGSRRGLGKGVWNMIEESELAKSIRLDEENKNESDIAARARACIAQLSSTISPTPRNNTPTPTPRSSSPTTPTMSPRPISTPTAANTKDMLGKAKALKAELEAVIPVLEDPVRMEELLSLNDQLTALLEALPPSPVVSHRRPVLAPLRGLGLGSNTGNDGDRDAKGNDGESAGVGGMPDIDGIMWGEVDGDRDREGEDDTPTTPWLDKGKAKAEPPPEEPEKVLSPTFMMTESSEDEDEDGEGGRFVLAEEELGEPASPTHRSRSWVEEEGEVFRKGTVLLGPEEMEGEYAGEELRKELLEAMVERPPPRPLTDEFGLEVSPLLELEPPTSPLSRTSPVTTEPAKPPPRPYIRARSSSQSIMSILSPTTSPVVDGEVPGSPRSPTSPNLGLRPSLSRTRGSGVA